MRSTADGVAASGHANPTITESANHFAHQTAPTQFVEHDGIRFAYRRFGKKKDLPLVFIPHILGNMDSWDPSITDGFAQDREVILFNNAGVASSSGEVPTTFADMARGAGAFVDALGLARWMFSAFRSVR